MNEYPSRALLVIYRIGLFLLAGYFAVSALSYYLWNANGLPKEIVFLNAANIVWLLAVVIMKGLKRGCLLRRKIVAVWLGMYMLSALWVNNAICRVFAPSSGWYAVALLLIGLNTLLLSYFDEMPQCIREIQAFVLGVTAWLLVYLVIYLAPFYPLGLVGAFIFGMSLTAFAPLLLTWYSWRVLRYTLWQHGTYRGLFLLGAGFSLTVVTGFCIYFTVVKHNMEGRYEQLVKRAAIQDPEAALAGELTIGFMEKRVLGTGIVYTTPLFAPVQSLLGTDGDAFDVPQTKIHDPLMMVTVLFCGESSIPAGEREVIARLSSGEKFRPRPAFRPPVVVDTSIINNNRPLPSAHEPE